ncbi:hypothetical protein SESBI_38312 [Sesbania bispinosa]|nr:hypothetical protein SESBI_38312 [Sesbania bispinosa]
MRRSKCTITTNLVHDLGEAIEIIYGLFAINNVDGGNNDVPVTRAQRFFEETPPSTT